MRSCPICGVAAFADELVFQYHVDSHFDDTAPKADGGRAESSSPRKRRMSTVKSREEFEVPDEDDEPL